MATPDFQVRKPVHCLISDFDSGALSGDNEIDMFGVYDYAHPWLSTVNTPGWPNNHGRRFAFGDNSPRMPISPPPVSTFSKEDLLFANRFSANLTSPSSEHTEVQAEESDLGSNSNASFRSQDFLTALQKSEYGTILLPVNETQRMAIDYAVKMISEPASTSRTVVSKQVASQMRTVGQFLVDFATRIDNQVEQVEIARSKNMQHESNQR